MISQLYLIGVGLAWSSGISLLFFYNPRKFKIKDGLVQAWQFLKSSDKDAIFQASGISLTMKKYNAIRIIVLYSFLIIALAAFFLSGTLKMIQVFCVGLLLYLLSWPGESKKKTPFKIVMDKLGKNYKQRKDDELMTVIVQLKNIIIAQGDNPWGVDYIMQSIMRFTNITKPIFANTIALMRLGKEDEAYKYFGEAFGTKLGHQFSLIVLKMDYLNPSEFMDQLDIFQKGIIEVRKTNQNRRQELTGVTMFSLASLEVLLVVANFVIMIVSYSINQMVM